MANETIDTIIGEDIVFKGSLKFNNNLMISGQIKGTIETNGNLIISDTGDVNADIQVGSLTVNGIFRGNIDSKNKISIGKTGKVSGDIRTPVLEIETGAKFSGNCSM
ncbi:MAG: polymer-forming cytoskeletal protein [Leptospiraceae bacterium]|nr:polymer-forming cytoskeletal protein [Leptospiraceae bacterium]